MRGLHISTAVTCLSLHKLGFLVVAGQGYLLVNKPAHGHTA